MFENEPFIGYDDEDEEPDEAELKRRKVRKAELNENARIVKEAEEKERAENEAHATLKSRMLLFHRWILKRIQNKVVDLPSQYWLDLVASFVSKTLRICNWTFHLHLRLLGFVSL